MEQVNDDRDTPSGQSRKREVQHTRNQNRRIVKLRVEQVALVRRISTKEESHGGCHGSMSGWETIPDRTRRNSLAIIARAVTG